MDDVIEQMRERLIGQEKGREDRVLVCDVCLVATDVAASLDVGGGDAIMVCGSCLEIAQRRVLP